ncbi:MAG: OmpA family protein [Nitrospirae bacterium]|nr:OmpA family protein [Nitrospirota bacterium]
MKFIKIVLTAVLGIVFLTGCVTTGKYEARVDDIKKLEAKKSDLEKTQSDLEEMLMVTQENLKKENASRSALEDDVARLKADQEELSRKAELLSASNKELNNNITELSQEKLNAIQEKERAIASLSKEKLSVIQEKDRAIAELKNTYRNLVSELNDEIKKGEIAVTQLRDKLTLSMVDKILFDTGSADIKKTGKQVLVRVAEILKKVTDKQIRIEGHTDNVPIGAGLIAKFPSNWELSTARSTTVVRYLQENGVDPKFLIAAGYSEFRPVDSNETVEGKAKNRRIEIVLIPLEAELGKK